MNKKHAFFRANVGIVVLNREGHVLACERADYRGAWQFPQGGMLASEEPVDAAYRELKEETGITWDQVKLLGEYPEWLAYELPADSRNSKKGRGQVQKWFLFLFLGSAKDIRPGHEFRTWKWMNFKKLATTTAPFRRPTYAKLLAFYSARRSRTISRKRDSPSKRLRSG